MNYDAVIVGGGAAGLAAAAFLGRAAAKDGISRRLLLLEKAPRVGKKLLATGNGTCNLSHRGASAFAYHGDPALAAAVLRRFSPEQATAFFTAIGVDCLTRADDRIYPLSEQAGAVLDALRLEAAACGVEMRCDSPVRQIQPVSGGWRIVTEGETLTARRVLVCTGGAASPSLGGSAEAYGLLTALGCEKTPLFPSLVQLRTETDFVRAVKGIRVDARVALRLDGRELASETGEVLFAEYGLSGPAVMQISRPVGDWERKPHGRMIAALDLFPDWTEERLTARLTERCGLHGRTLEDYLTGLVHKRVGQTVLRAAGIAPLSRAAESLTAAECRRIAAMLKNWEFTVLGTKGMAGAQVTAGGIRTDEWDPDTMECRRHPGLYAAGEVLNVDGDCGGYNLQFAWSSAYVAATAIAAGWQKETV